MKKYLFIYKTTVIDSLQYAWNLFFGFITYSLLMFIFLNLWQYIYSEPGQLIHGYSMEQMVWYVIFTEIMWFGNNNQTLKGQISEDIRSGAIAYGLNKPYNYLDFMIVKHFGEMTIKFFFYLGIGVAFGQIFVGKLVSFQVIYLPFIVITVLLGMLINSLIRIMISVFSFWIEDSFPFHWLYDKAILVVGTLFPIEMFPVWLQPIIRQTPIFVITYGPVKLIIDFTMELFLKVLFAQVIYVVVSIILISLIFKKGVRKLNVNGG